MKKKILVLGLVLIAVICFSSVVSAGWFDSGETTIKGSLEDKSIDYVFGNTTGGALIDKNGNMNIGDLSSDSMIHIKLDASDDELKKLNDSLKSGNITLNLDTDMKFGHTMNMGDVTNILSVPIKNITLNGNVLTIQLGKLFGKTGNLNSNYNRFNINEPLDGKININSGNITISNEMTITF